MNVLSAFALCLPALATYALLRRLATGSATALSGGLAAVVSPGLGVGFASCTYFLLLLATRSHRTAVWFDAMFWVAVCAGVAADRVRIGRAVASRPAWSNQPAAPVSTWRDPLVLVPAAGCLILATLATLSFWQRWAVAPHGEWDAWAIWNLRARAILRGAPDWAAVFSPAIAWSHVDYPLLLPMAVARLWAYTGQESPVIPAAIAMLFFASSLVTVATLVGRLRGWPAGLLAGMALLVPRTFVFQGSCQCGDIPIGFFVLVAIAFVLIGAEAPNPGPSLFVAGAAAGLAAWTKNEGALLLILVTLVVAVRTLSLRPLLPLAAGAAAPLVAIAMFHLRIAPPSNYLFNTPGGGNIADKLFDPTRWTMVTTRLVDLLPAWGNVPAGALAVLALSVVLIAGPDLAVAAPRGLGAADDRRDVRGLQHGLCDHAAPGGLADRDLVRSRRHPVMASAGVDGLSGHGCPPRRTVDHSSVCLKLRSAGVRFEPAACSWVPSPTAKPASPVQIRAASNSAGGLGALTTNYRGTSEGPEAWNVVRAR